MTPPPILPQVPHHLQIRPEFLITPCLPPDSPAPPYFTLPASPEGHARQLFQANLGHPGDGEKATLSRCVGLKLTQGEGAEKGLAPAGQ